jgi:small subunit ribosomal protein S19
MSRSVWKEKYVNPLLIKALSALVKYNNVEEKRYPLLIVSRNSTILPGFLGLKVSVYNGNRYVNLSIKENMINHKFGEFAYTKRMGNKIHKTKSGKITKPGKGENLKITRRKK